MSVSLSQQKSVHLQWQFKYWKIFCFQQIFPSCGNPPSSEVDLSLRKYPVQDTKNKQTKSSLRALGLHHFPLKVVLMKYIPSAYADFDQKWYRCLNMRFRLHCRSTWRNPGHLSGAGWWDMQGTHLPEVQLQLGGGHAEASGIIKSQNHYRIGLTQVVSLNLCRATRFHAIKHPICYCY